MTVLFARISDNVLEPADWPIRRLEVADDGTVVRVDDVKVGVYAFADGPRPGWTKRDLEHWAAFDSTGGHPEIYHELSPVAFKE